jgi:hypothetical protein
MERRDLGVDEVTAAKRLGYCSKAINLPVEFNRQPVALTEFSIEIGHCPRLPLVSSALAAAPLQ